MGNEPITTKLVLEAAEIAKTRSGFDHTADFCITTKRAKYFFDQTFIEGDMSRIFFGYEDNDEKTEVVLKLIGDISDNDLGQNEIKTLNHLFAEETAPQLKHLPRLLDQFIDVKTGQLGLIMTQFEGYDLRTVRKHRLYENGISDQHMAWIWCRLLSVLGYAHKKGIIHGNVEPSHILIQPRNHNLCLIDWTGSIFNDGFKIFNEDFSAPEVAEKQIPTPAADLYSSGKCMLYLLGGDLKTNSIPNSVDVRMRQFLNYFLLPSPLQRAQDAWESYAQLENLRTEIWSEERFHEFEW